MTLPVWKPGQHLCVVGETGSGKSTLMEWLGRQRKYLLIVRTKPDDTTYLTDRRVTTPRALKEALADVRANRIEVAPDRKDRAAQFQMVRAAIQAAWDQGGWTIDLDELLYIDRLGLLDAYEQLLTQGRSLKLSVMSGMQRPVQVSRFALSQSMHVVCFGLEGRDVAMNLAPATSPRMKEVVPTLGRHEWAWYSRIDRRITVGRLNLDTDALEEIRTA